MCTIVVINRGEKEIGTPREFLKHFDVVPFWDRDYSVVGIDDCLCQCDLDATFFSLKVDYRIIDGDYYVGKLDELV